MTKKIIYVIVGILIVTGAIVIIFYFKNNNILTNQTVKSPAIKLINDKIYFPKLINNKIYYIGSDQQTISFINLESNKKEDIIKSSEKIVNVFWGNQENDFIIQTKNPDSDIANNWYYNSIKNQFQPLPNEITIVSWSEDDKQIIYNYFKSNDDYDPNTINALFSAKPNGSSNKKVVDLKMDIPKNILIGSDNFLITTDNSGYGKNDILAYDAKNANFINITNDGFVNNSKWSPNHKYILYYTLNPQTNKTKLFIMDSKGSNKKDYNITSEINKSIIDNTEKFLIVAIPQNNNKSYDDFYKINIETGEKTLLFKSSSKEHYSASNLMLSEDGKTLYFTSDDYLYKMEIE